MKKRIFAVAAALCLMAGTGAFAQEAKPAAAPKERPTVEQMAQRMTERMQKELKLTDAQAKEVYNLNFQQIKEMQAMREKIRAKDHDLKGQMASQGTTPRRFTDLLGSLCDLTSGSGDRGTPVVLVQGYFTNFASED